MNLSNTSIRHNGVLSPELRAAIRGQYKILNPGCLEGELEAVELIASLAADSLDELHALMTGVATIETWDGSPAFMRVSVAAPQRHDGDIIARLTEGVCR